jgi:hypothetical protein
MQASTIGCHERDTSSEAVELFLQSRRCRHRSQTIENTGAPISNDLMRLVRRELQRYFQPNANAIGVEGMTAPVK